jgi:hypothetical protein
MPCCLQNCVLQGADPKASQPPLRILLPGGTVAEVLQNLTSTYQELVDIPIELDIPGMFFTPSGYADVRARSIGSPGNYSTTHEAWMTSAMSLGDGIASGAFKALTELVVFDQVGLTTYSNQPVLMDDCWRCSASSEQGASSCRRQHLEKIVRGS